MKLLDFSPSSKQYQCCLVKPSEAYVKKIVCAFKVVKMNVMLQLPVSPRATQEYKQKFFNLGYYLKQLATIEFMHYLHYSANTRLHYSCILEVSEFKFSLVMSITVTCYF